MICLVTDGRGDTAAALERIRAAAAAGVDLVQIREPHLTVRALVDLTRAACNLARVTGTRIVVNDRLDVALAAGADGVHLRADSVAASRARLLAGERFLIGRSVHSVEDALTAEREGGCDYLFFGTVFASPSKPVGHRSAGVEELREVCGRVGLPVVAIGGISIDRIDAVRDAGASGVAAISLFAEIVSNPSIVASLRRAFDTRSTGCLKYLSP